jgi:hypothetical protein
MIREVNRVRGKNILWLSLIAMFLSVMFVNVGSGELSEPILYIDPPRIPESGFGHPGDEYTMSVKIQDVVDLWTISFRIRIALFTSVLVPSEIYEGDFMKSRPEGSFPPEWPTTFIHSVDGLYGIIAVTITRMPISWPPTPNEGASGSGTLMTFKLSVVEAGVSGIKLEDSVLIDSTGHKIGHEYLHSEYVGVYAKLTQWGLKSRKSVTAGDLISWETYVENMGDEPLYVRVRCDVDRIEDARRIVIRSGQTYGGGGLGEPLPYEYLYLDEFMEWFYEWKNPATNALGTPDGLYIEGDANGQWASLYSFEDITLGGREINDIYLEGYSQYPNGATEAVDIDVYGFSSVSSFAWLGSNFGTDSWGWRGIRWTADSVLTIMPELADENELNNMAVLIYNYHGDAPDVIRVDSMRLKVEFASITPTTPPVFVVQPGEKLVLDPILWPSTADHVGHYAVTVTVEYHSAGWHWNSWGAKQDTFSFQVKP